MTVAFPADVAHIVDNLYPPARQALADMFAGTTRRLFVADAALSIALPAALWLTGTAVRLRAFLQRLIKRPFALAFTFALLVIVAWALVTLPLSYYESFVLIHRFGLSRESSAQWFHDWAIGLAISAIVGAFVSALFVRAVARWPRRWPARAIAAAAAFVVLAFAIFPTFIAPLFNRYTPLPPTPLTKSILSLAAAQGIDARVVYEYDISRQSLEANAYVSGLGGTQRIAIGDNLLRNFKPDEILYVVAHEMGHYRLGHLWIGAATTWCAAIAAILAIWLFGTRLLRLDLADAASLAPVAVILACFNIIIMPVSNAVSRSVEHAADAFAAAHVHTGDAGVRAFARLANEDLSPLHPPPLVVWFFYTHPPMDERIVYAARAAQGRDP